MVCITAGQNHNNLSLPLSHCDSLNIWKEIISTDVIKLVKSFTNSNSPYYCDMSMDVLKFVVDIIAESLAIVLNASLFCGCFPDSLKLSQAGPIYKKGSSEKVSSYRPISIILTFCKVMEGLINQQLVSFFENKLFSSAVQHGFMHGK